MSVVRSLNKLREMIEPWSFTALRIVVGIVMVAHGHAKLTDTDAWVGHFTHMGIPAPEVSVYFAIAGEFFGGIGLIAGAFTSLAALGVIGSMAVAIFYVHLDNGLMAKNGGFEYPLTLLAAGILFATRGGGPHSVDAVLKRMRG